MRRRGGGLGRTPTHNEAGGGWEHRDLCVMLGSRWA